MLQTEAYFTIVIYDRKSFIVQATEQQGTRKKEFNGNERFCSTIKIEDYIRQGILNGEVSLYRWPPVWLVWNWLYDNWQFLFLFAKQTNPNQSNRRSMVQWCFPPFSIPCIRQKRKSVPPNNSFHFGLENVPDTWISLNSNYWNRLINSTNWSKYQLFEDIFAIVSSPVPGAPSLS